MSSRLFTRFSTTSAQPRIDKIPDSGFCLSVFLVISQTGNKDKVLLGKPNVNAPWEHIGALDKDRVINNSNRWMLPSSHLIFGESPWDAAKRVSDEQLGIRNIELQGPFVFSEVWGPKNHWDIEFIFQGERNDVPQHDAWKELKFLDTTKLRREDFARSHEDILEHIGMWRDTR
ncbi:MAG: NUDIX hydrolase [Candidatus Parvarchaeota archaeon]